MQLGVTSYTGDPGPGIDDPSSILGANMYGDSTPVGTLIYPFSGFMRNLSIIKGALSSSEINSLYSKNIQNEDSLARTKVCLDDSDSLKHFYSLSSDANDEVGSINGTLVNNLEFNETGE